MERRLDHHENCHRRTMACESRLDIAIPASDALRQKELDRRLRRLFLEHRTIIEETGANNLYLAMGFLRWRGDKRKHSLSSRPSCSCLFAVSEKAAQGL